MGLTYTDRFMLHTNKVNIKFLNIFFDITYDIITVDDKKYNENEEKIDHVVLKRCSKLYCTLYNTQKPDET